jgi:predicted permease
MAVPIAPDHHRPDWVGRLCTGAARLLARRVPSIAADPDGPDDIAETVQAVCLMAARRGGRAAAIRAGALELANLLGLALRRASSSPEPDPPHRRRWPAWQLSARFAWKRLVGARTNAAWAIGTLALGIGLTTAVFSVLDSILWRPAPYPHADRLVELATYNVDRKFTFAGFYSPALLRAWRAESDLFDRVEGFDTPVVPYEGDDGSETVAEAIVTPGVFSLLGAVPERGRLFTDGEGRSGASDAVVVSDAFWRERLHGDPEVVGRRLMIDNAPCHIVGVLPASFRFPNGRTEVWVPFDVGAPPGATARPLTPLARIAPGRTFEAAAIEARARGGRLGAAVGEPANQTAVLYPLSDTVDDKTVHSLWVLAAAVGFLFLVVAANVANLSLARALQGRRDLAVHAALGASAADLVRAAFIENALVAAIGCTAGTALAAALTRLARVSLPEAMTTAAFTQIALNGRAALVAVALGAVAAIVFGLPMAVFASRTSLTAALGAQSRSATGSRASRRLRSLLVVVEVAICTELLIGAALMTRAFVALETAGKGFDAANLITVRVGLPASGYRDPALRRQFVDDVLARLRTVPGVVAATDGGLPTDARPIMLGPVTLDDQPDRPTAPMMVPMHEVPASYFDALRLPLVSGRIFGPDDDRNTVMVSEAFAHKYWPARSAVGARFQGAGQDWQTIVGVVGNIRPMTSGGLQNGQDLYYQSGKAPAALQPRISAASSIIDYRTLIVRAEQGTDLLTNAPRVIHTIDPRVVIWRTALVDRLYDDAIARPRTVFLLMAVFAGVGLLLAVAGMYGVLSQLVSQRLREIGVRFALGARPADVGRLVLGSGLVVAGAGLACGLVLSAALTRAAATLLTDVGKPDALSVAVVVGVLGITALAASWSPAMRAMRVDPVRLLRDE